jgi:hypothetical protein
MSRAVKTFLAFAVATVIPCGANSQQREAQSDKYPKMAPIEQ